MVLAPILPRDQRTWKSIFAQARSLKKVPLLHRQRTPRPCQLMARAPMRSHILIL
ncbi:hypothetical protein EMCG_09509 [[Emmonsia] crescens]|uniref:Uncharacterized protein n=1 Tax=[Emmonsia] crescens TaxID=73230 RepID=A0A0G2I321_9EURO|nr:hypothetical protein EMCG_09509 [Emmonsia crescens UAMH 3008]